PLLLEIQHGIEPAVQADERGHTTDREQRAVYIWNGAAAGVMPDREFLIRQTEDDLRTDHEPGKAKRVNLRPAQVRATGFTRTNGVFNGDRRDRSAHAREARCELTRGATRRVNFAVVGVVENLPLRNELGCHLRE